MLILLYSQQDTGPVAPSAPHRAASHRTVPHLVNSPIAARQSSAALHVAKYAPDVSEQSPRDRDTRSRKIVPAAGGTQTHATSRSRNLGDPYLTVSRPIDPILRSVECIAFCLSGNPRVANRTKLRRSVSPPSVPHSVPSHRIDPDESLPF